MNFINLLLIIVVIIAVLALVVVITRSQHPNGLVAKILRNRLSKYGIDPKLYPIEQLATHVMNLLGVQTAPHKTRAARVYADEISKMVVNITTGVPREYSASEIRSRLNQDRPSEVEVIWQILAMHDPKRFGMIGALGDEVLGNDAFDALKKTQLHNAALLEMAGLPVSR
jgi:hypothetical protein